jgi:hypothetical protein
VTAYGVALVHAAIGDAEAAFTWLDRAFAERSHWLVWLRLDPRFDGLRADPRMSELLRRIGFPEGVDLSPAHPAHPIGGSPGLPLKR